MNITAAHKSALRSLNGEPGAVSVLVEFVVQATGITKFLQVHKNGELRVMDWAEVQAEGLA